MNSDEHDEDSLLIVQSLHDPAAFGHFYRRNLESLLAWMYRRTLDAEVAADLTAETFATVISKRDQFDPQRGPARAWLWGIAKHEVQHWYRDGVTADRARRRVGIPTVQADDDAIAYVESLVDLGPVADQIRVHMAALPPSERAAVELRILRELSYDEVSRYLGCASGAARVRVSRGLSRLRHMLGDDFAVLLGGGAE